MCDVLTGVHSGTETVARTHRWNLPVVAQALINLATGTPYSEVSRWAKLHLAPKRRDARWATPDAFADPSTGEEARTGVGETSEADGEDKGTIVRVRPADSTDIDRDGAEVVDNPFTDGDKAMVVLSRTDADAEEP